LNRYGGAAQLMQTSHVSPSCPLLQAYCIEPAAWPWAQLQSQQSCTCSSCTISHPWGNPCLLHLPTAAEQPQANVATCPADEAPQPIRPQAHSMHKHPCTPGYSHAPLVIFDKLQRLLRLCCDCFALPSPTELSCCQAWGQASSRMFVCTSP
jgi:hypothetical protein